MVHLSGTFDFIECFMTTFLHAHSWLNWVAFEWQGTPEVMLSRKSAETAEKGASKQDDERTCKEDGGPASEQGNERWCEEDDKRASQQDDGRRGEEEDGRASEQGDEMK